MEQPIRYLSVCSGIEAATVAWHHLGWQPVAFSEIEPFPCAVLKYHHPSVPNWGDMTKFRSWPDATVDLLVGGTPCQSFSVAGLRAGLCDPRGNLALTYLAIVERYRPRWLVWENVPGVLSSNGGRDFGAILGGMAELGYGVAYRVLDAQFVRTRRFGRAVPQRRRRVFVVGYLGDWRRAAAVLFDRESLRRHPAPRRTPGQIPAPTIAARPAGGGGLGTEFDLNGGLITKGYGGGNTSGPIDAAACLTAKGQKVDFEVETFVAHSLRARPQLSHQADRDTLVSVAHALRAEGHDASEDGTGRGTPLIPIAIQERAASETLTAGPDGAGFRADGASYTLEARPVPQAVAFDCKSSEVQAVADGSHPTLRSMAHDASHANSGGHAAVAYGLTTTVTPKVATDHALTLTTPAPTGGGQPQTVAFAQNTRDEVRLTGGYGQITAALAAEAGMKHQTYLAQQVAFDLRGRDEGAVSEGLHDTANIRAASGGSSRSDLAAPWAVRRLTPRECERLQGFPDDYTLIPYRHGKPAADGPRYKALGNSMAVNVMEWIGARIAMVDGIGEE